MSPFSASYDRTTKIISVVIAAILLVPIITTHSIAVAVLAAVLLLVAYAYSPRSYEISERSILVHRLIGNVRIPLDHLREARIAQPDDLTGAIRLWGNGGLFGYYGLFRTSKLGKCSWYVTNRRNMVVLTTGSRTALVSPDNVDGFLSAVRTIAPSPSFPTGAATEPDRPRLAAPLLGAAIGIAVAILVLAVVVLAFTYAPGPPAYTLTPGSLSIHDRFYPVTLTAATVDVAGIRLLDPAADAGWNPVERTNGFANTHYQSGWFRVRNGQKVRMYCAEGVHLVLLPPKGEGVTVLLAVEDPERFIERLRRGWSASPR